MASNKGKEVAGKYSGKGKRPAEPGKSGGREKRNRGAVQFFEDAAYEVGVDDDDDVSDISGFGDWDFFDDEFEAQSSKVNNETGKAYSVPLLPKEEELSGDELEKMVEDRYRPGSSYVTYADDKLNTKIAVDETGLPSYKEPTIWKVKCVIGREKQSVFCLMQKYVEFNSLGNKLQIISAFSIERVKGFIYIEADKQSDINEACRGVSTVYSSRVAPVPKNEVSTALSVRSKGNEVSVGSWARVKNGKYKGDLAQVIAVNDTRKKATVKLIPRIDLQMLAGKFGGGVRSKKNASPAPRLVTSSELEEFRPLIQHRRDRESGLAFEVLDGMMLKDGYLYKKVSIDSLSLYGVIPSEDELLKFESSKNEVPDCQEWLTELYGEKKKEPRIVKSDKGGGGKGEGSSSSSAETSFEVNNLVLFNRKDFGVIVGSEKDEYYKILKEGSEGPVVLTIDVRQLKKISFENRFTALDKCKKMISINDTVRILEGPSEGRQGIVKHIYRGIIFLHDEVEQENNGYFCCKSQICEKIKLSAGASKGKDGESSFPTFDDPPSSPKSPLAPEKPWETRGRNSNFNAEDKEGFTVGQSLRIRVGPLKGYLCRVLAIRRTDVTVKLDSQHKILTVKSEHLAEVRQRSSAIPMSDEKDAKPFDLLGNPDGSADWMTGAGTSADGERSSWPAFPSSGTSVQPESSSAMETDNKDEGGGGWGSKVTAKPSSTWGNAAADEKPAVSNEQAGGWGNGGGNWGKPKTSTEDQVGSSQGAGGWGSGGGNWGNKPKPASEDQGGSSQDAGGNWGSKPNSAASNDATSTWGKKDNSSNEGSNWGKSLNAADKVSSGGDISGSTIDWGSHAAKPTSQSAAWGKSAIGDVGQAENWGKTDNKKDDTSPGWVKTSNASGSQGGNWGKSNMKDADGAPAWGKAVESPNAGQGGNWGKSNTKSDDTAPAWGKAVESCDARQGGSWGNVNTKNNDSAPAWGKTAESSDSGQGGIWDKSVKKNNDSAPAWGKRAESTDGGQGASWGKNSTEKDASAPAWGKTVESTDGGQGGSWGNSSGGGGSSWGKQGRGGSSWGQQNDGNSEGYGGWKKDGGDQQDTNDGGRGFGGRRGRGGWRGSDRGGRSFDKDEQGGEKGGFGGGREGGGWSDREGGGWRGRGRGGRSFGEDDQSEEKGGLGGGRGGWSDRGGRGRWRGSGRGGRSFGEDDQGEEKGGFGGGRSGGGWSDRGGRGSSDRGSFRGRGRSDWGGGGGGGFGGRGRGRRDENSDWGNNQNDGGNEGGQSWGSGGGGGGGWSKGNDGGGSGRGSWNKPGHADGSPSSGWGAPKETNGASGGSGRNNKGSGSGGNWNRTGSADVVQPSILGPSPGSGSGFNSGGGSWDKPGPMDGGQSSGWGTSKGANEDGGSGGQWGKPSGGSSIIEGQSSGWGAQKGANEGGGSGGGWGKPAGSGSSRGMDNNDDGTIGANEGGGSGGQWGKPAGGDSGDGDPSSVRGTPKEANEGGGSGGGWGKPAGGASSWGKRNNDGGSKGGW